MERGMESMAQASRAVPKTTSIETAQIALAASRPTLGFEGSQPGSSFSTPVILAIASTPLSARMVSDEVLPHFPVGLGARERLQIRRGEMRHADGQQDDHEDDHRHAERDRETAAVLRAVPIQPAHDAERAGGGDDDVLLEEWDIEVIEAGPAAERGGDGEIGDQQQRADDREQPALRARGGINAAAIRKVPADDEVVHARPAR